ncbi:hypothetical protein DICPUDRAFT_85090 [Dictyostelium purpureum]|uniref:Transmembrane protein n=1 Tax=Dictyostelium purpureum TaxID=5786 RepID=F1A4N6_DICPU|nr:uncharacterized protein DICPUDRAFT_85090 [Dictyostelium purpureum]EGC28843.1 hypothetical protein DICPUDRAFT_85090 [Dictyostelium purpureum]|eukprot:XP_003294629.1 hypothetical protein DICPUDRAFT_85090 [Dictyostelium purpureum]
MPKASIISIILLTFSLISLIFSFSSYWYYDKTKVNGKVILEHFYEYNKYKTLKTLNTNSTVSTTTTTIQYYDSQDEYNNRNYLTIFRLSIAFASVSFICIAITLVYLFYQTLRKTHHPPHRLHQYIRIFFKMLILFGVLCSGISLFIFIGVNDEKKKDCLRLYSKNLCNNINTKFFYTYSYVDNSASGDENSDGLHLKQTDSFTFYAQPYIAWYMMVCATTLSLISVFVIFMGDAFDTTKLNYQTIL